MAEDEYDDDESEETTSTSAISGRQATGSASRMSWALPIAAAALIGVAILAAIFLLSSRGSAKPRQRQVDTAGGGGGGATQGTTEATVGKVPPALPRETATMPPKTTMKVRTTKHAMTTMVKTSTAQMTPTTVATTRTTQVRPLSPNSMLCIFGSKLDPRMTFPEDGICDVSFFQAAEKEGPFLEGKSGGRSLDVFTAAAAKHSKTEYGISLDYNYHVEAVDAVSKPVAKKTVADLDGKKIYHWGYLNNKHYSLRAKNVSTQFAILRKVKEIVDEVAKPPRPHYFVYRDSFTTRTRKKRNLKYHREILWLDGFVVLTHLIDDDRDWIAGRTLPPTFWVNLNMVDSSYAYSLTTGHKALDDLAKEPMNGTAMFLSVTMAARRYHPDEKNAYLVEVKMSNETLLVSPTDYCKNSNYEFGFSEKNPVAPFYSSTKEERFIAFDDSRSIAVKFCQGKENRTALKYGMAVFDVEMEDSENKCGKGAYVRLKAVRKLVDYMNNNFTSPSGLANCAK